jgi:transcriptional regulator with XRE-family HTH domain
VAKIKVSPHPGALSELLKKKGMTQTDAFEKTRVDRKTLLKIERGDEVKLETLQQVAIKLQVTEEYFRHPPTAEVTAATDDAPPEWGTIMLRKLDVARLEELLRQAARPRWELNAQVRENGARKFLVELEGALEKFWGQVNSSDIDAEGEPLSLREQLDRLKTADDIAARLEQLAEHRLTLLGGTYQFWECSETTYEEHIRWSYFSSDTPLLSIEPFGTLSRRAQVSEYAGSPPPNFPISIEDGVVVVNGVQWTSLEEL